MKRLGLPLLCVLVLCTASATAAPSAVDKLVDLSAQRLLLADEVAASKAQTGKTVEDLARETEQLELLTAKAGEHQLAQTQVAAFFRWQIEANKLIQYQLLAEASQPVGNPMDLNEIRIRLNALNRDLLQNLGPALDDLKHGACAERLRAAIDEGALRRSLDPLHKIALVRAFGDTCRGL
jgi:chorismate mutase